MSLLFSRFAVDWGALGFKQWKGRFRRWLSGAQRGSARPPSEAFEEVQAPWSVPMNLSP